MEVLGLRKPHGGGVVTKDPADRVGEGGWSEVLTSRLGRTCNPGSESPIVSSSTISGTVAESTQHQIFGLRPVWDIPVDSAGPG